MFGVCSRWLGFGCGAAYAATKTNRTAVGVSALGGRGLQHGGCDALKFGVHFVFGVAKLQAHDYAVRARV